MSQALTMADVREGLGRHLFGSSLERAIRDVESARLERLIRDNAARMCAAVEKGTKLHGSAYMDNAHRITRIIEEGSKLQEQLQSLWSETKKEKGNG